MMMCPRMAQMSKSMGKMIDAMQTMQKRMEVQHMGAPAKRP